MSDLLVPEASTQIVLRDWQDRAVEDLRQGLRGGHLRQLLYAPTGAGKCLGRGTEVLRSDGSIVPVEEIRPGDRLMGDDGTPRNVLSIASGREQLYRVVPKKGDPWVCNASHLLSLKVTPGSSGMYLADGTHIEMGEELVAVEAGVLAKSNCTAQHCLKGWRAPAIERFERAQADRSIPPYILGAWLGDGTRRLPAISKPPCRMVDEWIRYGAEMGLSVRIDGGTSCPTWYLTTGKRGGFMGGNVVLDYLRSLGVAENKRIPDAYKYGPASVRREILAGLIDSDGHVTHKGVDWLSVDEQLAKDFAFVARSLGLSCYLSKQKKGIRKAGFENDYWRASVSGDLDEIPMRDKRAAPRLQKKRHRVHGLKLEPIGEGEYFGFEIDGNRLFLLGDFTVTHNTYVGAHMLQQCRMKGLPAAFLVDRIALAAQTSEALWDFGLEHGIAQGENTTNRQSPLQICSQQTCEKRGYFPDMAMALLDECHTMRSFTTDFFLNSRIPLIGLTATPFTPGLGKLYSRVVNVTTTNKLIDDGVLAPLIAYAAKEIDMEGAKLSNGEWSDKTAEERALRIVGDVVLEWQDKTEKHFNGPVKTICFSSSVAHGEELCRQFQAAGFNFQQVTYKTSPDERKRLIKDFRRPDTDIIGLVSVEALAKGFDVPDILCGIGARPLRSGFSGHIQMIGRVMRSHPGKEYALWLDHSGNYLGFFDRMNDLFENGVSELDDSEKQKEPRQEKAKEKTDFACKGCGFILKPAMNACPACGHERLKRSAIETVAGQMEEVDGTRAKPKEPVKPYLKNKRSVWGQILCMAHERREGEAAHKFALAQYRNLYGSWPSKSWGAEPLNNVDMRLRSHIRANLIRYAKGKAKAA